MPNIGPAELIVILVIALLVLGPKKLPEVGKSLGKGIREFKDNLASADEPLHDDEPAARRAPAQVAPPPPPVETGSSPRNRTSQDR